jgi:hypothetical protein
MNIDILREAAELLGSPPAIPPDHRGWAHWWCPFHNDSERAGRGGHPNFGINLELGYYKCLRCGASGPSLSALSHQLGRGWRPELSQESALNSFAGHDLKVSHIPELDEALAAARSALRQSPAMPYLKQRGIRPYTALVYGLAYGQPAPDVSGETARLAYESRLMLGNGAWLWAGGVVYADPLTHPTVLNVRYIPDEFLKEGTRPFPIEAHHHTWGVRRAPLGAWRITPRTRALVVVEGLFDMLVGAQVVAERQLHPEVVVVYTNGASPARRMLDWFAEHAAAYDHLLIPDPDPAGLGGRDEASGKEIPGWLQHLSGAIERGGGRFAVVRTPDRMDPDEAFLSGWWPSII